MQVSLTTTAVAVAAAAAAVAAHWRSPSQGEGDRPEDKVSEGISSLPFSLPEGTHLKGRVVTRYICPESVACTFHRGRGRALGEEEEEELAACCHLSRGTTLLETGETTSKELEQ